MQSLQTNEAFYSQLQSWKRDVDKGTEEFLKIVNDGTTCNASRKGAVACISFVVNQYELNDKDALICAGLVASLVVFSLYF